MDQEANRSTFVTVVGWIFIVLVGFTTFIAILQNIMISLMFSGEHMAEALNQAEAQNVPLLFRFLFSNVRLFFFGILVVSGGIFASAIGLLLRKNRRRVAFIFVMCFGIAWSIFSVIMQFTIFPSGPEIPDEQAFAQFNLMLNIMKIFMSLMAGGICILFGWIIKKLVSPPIRAEFVKGGAIAEATSDSYGGSAGAPPPGDR